MTSRFTHAAFAPFARLTKFPVRFRLECQTCGHRHESVWPSMPGCPVCTARTAGDGIDYEVPIDVDTWGNGTFRARPGVAETILSGRVTDEMIFEQAAFVRQIEAAATMRAGQDRSAVSS